MQELAESEVTVVTPPIDAPVGTIVTIENEKYVVEEDGNLRPLNDDMISEKAFRALVHRMHEIHSGRRSKHRRGYELCTKTPTAMRRAVNRRRNKVAKQARKVNRGSYRGR